LWLPLGLHLTHLAEVHYAATDFSLTVYKLR